MSQLSSTYTAIDHNYMDKAQFESIMRSSSILKSILSRSVYIFPSIENFAFDAFLLLYKPVLFLVPPEENQSSILQYGLIQAYFHSPSLNKIRLRTSGSKSNTYLCLKWLLDSLLEKTRGTDWFSSSMDIVKKNSHESLKSLENKYNSFLDNKKDSGKFQNLVESLKSMANALEKTPSKLWFSKNVYDLLSQIEKKQNSSHLTFTSSSLKEKTIRQNHLAFSIFSQALSNVNKKKEIANASLPSYEREDSNDISRMDSKKKTDFSFEQSSSDLKDKSTINQNKEKRFQNSSSHDLDKKNLNNESLNSIKSSIKNQNKSKDEPPKENSFLKAAIEDAMNKSSSSFDEPSNDDSLKSSSIERLLSEIASHFEENEKDSLENNSSNTPSTSSWDNKEKENKMNSSNPSTLEKGELSSQMDSFQKSIHKEIESIFSKNNAKNLSSSPDAHGSLEPFNQNDFTDMDHIENGSYTGKNSPTSIAFSPVKTKWTPHFSHVTPELSEQIIPQELKEKINSLNLDEDLNALENPLINFKEQIETLGISPPSVELLDFDELINLHKRLNKPIFIDFVNKVGRQKICARRIQGKKKQKKRFQPRDTLTRSQDLDLLVDDEFINLAMNHSSFENDFIDRYLRSDLLTVEMYQEVGRYKGPIILCYDGSGSMDGIKIEETKSHILSILEIAKIQKRTLVLIQFASASEPLFIKKINPKKIHVQDVLSILDTFLCGGTDFEKPLSKAIEFIKADKRNHSDILFITDGQCEISTKFQNRFLELKKKRLFHLYTIIIHSYTYQDYGDIGKISDEILEISENRWHADVDKHLFSLL